jgi:hypothetical protein
MSEETTTTPAAIVKSMATIQSSLKAPKGQTNKFGGYKYRSCEDILESVKPHLKKHGLVLTITDDITEVGGRVYVQATATVHNDEGHSVSTTGFAREEENKKGMDSSQITGSASSYARKYALNGLFCIDDTKDSDATNSHGRTSPGRVNAPAVSKEKLASAKKQIAKGKGLSDEEMEQLENYIRSSKNSLAAFQAVDEKHGKRMTAKQNDALKAACG